MFPANAYTIRLATDDDADTLRHTRPSSTAGLSCAAAS